MQKTALPGGLLILDPSLGDTLPSLAASRIPRHAWRRHTINLAKAIGRRCRRLPMLNGAH
ncbi:hypothetical protein HPA02_27040 [Bisbaumannia pacifica]|uniref:Uncharacterized protein n=1 Tax=Bisbaumannia pacifica TaxID=77098 RepID=A0A510XBM0_9GAMM|nr:hypothetical protein HPA02_27040 [Halomonas pacifica]